MAQLRNSSDRYGLVARVLHWSIGLLIIGQLLLGFWAFEFMERNAERSAMIYAHKGLGVLLLILVLVRIGWRSHDAPPALPASMNMHERKGARIGHALLYILMLSMPVLGLLTADTGGRATDVFGMFEVPMMVGENENLHDFFEDAHKFGAYLLGLAVLLHLGAALHHRFRRKDQVLQRML